MKGKTGPGKNPQKAKPADGQPTNNQPAKVIVDFPIAKLKEHPLQKSMYRGRTDFEVEELARSMAQGQDESIEILPNGMLIAGHGRVAAAKLLGWKTIPAWIRHDLAKAGPEAIERRLIESNLFRRQLTRLDMARSYRHLMRFARDKKGRPVKEAQAEQNLRELIRKRFRVSDKTLDRWLHVLDLPLSLQEAVEEDRLPLTLAVRVASLKPAVQEQVAERVRQGEAPRDVIMPLLTKGKGETAGKPLTQLVLSLRRAGQELAGRVAEVEVSLFSEYLQALRDGRQLLDALIAKGESDQARQARGFERLAARLGGRGDEEE
jgi:ParB-like chromosome segregation protein Spo0J